MRCQDDTSAVKDEVLLRVTCWKEVSFDANGTLAINHRLYCILNKIIFSGACMSNSLLSLLLFKQCHCSIYAKS